MLDVQIGATPTHLDLKVIQRNEELLLDLRPHESHPAIYSRALVELGPPFFSDGWGPTLIMPLGSGEAMSQLEACLPGLEILAFKRFAEVVERVLGNASIAANVQAAMDLVGFSADLQRVRSGFAAWRQGSSDGPDGDTVNASTEAALP